MSQAGELKLAPEEESDKLSDVLGSNGSSQGVSSESSEKLTTPTNKQVGGTGQGLRSRELGGGPWRRGELEPV